MSIVAWIVIGLLGGALAKLIMPGKQGGGFFATLILGVIGALVGGFIGGLITGRDFTTGINMTTLITAILGSILVSFIWAAIVKRRG